MQEQTARRKAAPDTVPIIMAPLATIKKPEKKSEVTGLFVFI